MIPRLSHRRGTLGSHVEWPDNPDAWGSDESPFAPRAPLRKLRVVIDNDLYRVPDSPYDLTPEEVLSGLLMHEYVTCYRYADDGPPPGEPIRTVDEWTTAYEGWVVMDPPDDQPDSRGIRFCTPNGITLGTAYVDRQRGARSDAVAYLDLPEALAADKREADALALQVAYGVDADIFVTDRPYLYRSRHSGSLVKICHPKEALAIVGLYLRSQGVYRPFRTVRVAPKMGRDVYFTVGALELLPAIWRWGGACGQESRATGDDTLSELGGALIARMRRALEARDDLHRVLNRAQSNNTRSTMLANLDVVLLLLTAASDVTARVAHLVLQLPGKPFDAGWQRQGWVEKVRKACSNLADLLAEGTPGFRTMSILSGLRNTIHAEVLGTLLAHQSSSPTALLFKFPQTQQLKLAEMMKNLGGHQSWGVREIRSGDLHADPGVFTDRLFACVLELLNAVMEGTPVEGLPTVVGKLPDAPPEPRDAYDRYTETNRSSIRWQLGF